MLKKLFIPVLIAFLMSCEENEPILNNQITSILNSDSIEIYSLEYNANNLVNKIRRNYVRRIDGQISNYEDQTITWNHNETVDLIESIMYDSESQIIYKRRDTYQYNDNLIESIKIERDEDNDGIYESVQNTSYVWSDNNSKCISNYLTLYLSENKITRRISTTPTFHTDGSYNFSGIPYFKNLYFLYDDPFFYSSNLISESPVSSEGVFVEYSFGEQIGYGNSQRFFDMRIEDDNLISWHETSHFEHYRSDTLFGISNSESTFYFIYESIQ